MGESPLEKLRRLKREDESVARRGSGGAGGPGDGRSLRRTGLGAILVAVLFFVVTKGKLILLFLVTKGKLLLGALKAGPLLTTFSTMAVSAWFYAGYFGVWLGVGIVVMILIHELGHGAAAKAMRLDVGAPVFIPFFGAVIALKEQPRSTWIEAVVGYGGPLAGTLGGLVVLAVSRAQAPGWERDFLSVLAWFTFLINLFNLLPVFGLDGDRVSKSFRPWHWLPGTAVLVAVLMAGVSLSGRPNPVVLFILFLGCCRAGARWWKSRRGEEAAPARLVDRLREDRGRYREEEDVRPAQRHAAAAAYFLLVAGLALLTALTEVRLPAAP